MLGQFVARSVGNAFVAKKRALRRLLVCALLAVIAFLFACGALAFGLAALYQFLTPFYMPPAEAALIIGGGLLLLDMSLLAVALCHHAAPSLTTAPNPQARSPERSAIEALAMLNSAMTDMGKARGGVSPLLGLLGAAALVGFASGRRR